MTPLMPKATAVWLIDNTALTFDQIAEFCGLHSLEIKGIADGDLATSIMGVDPTSNGQLTPEEIARCEGDASARLQLLQSAVPAPIKRTKGPKYTPLAKRQDKPDAILWLLKRYEAIDDKQIIKLVGTTKQTIAKIRSREHWNYKNLNPRDPALLGLCSQSDLDDVVESLEKQETPVVVEKKADSTAKGMAGFFKY